MLHYSELNLSIHNFNSLSTLRIFIRAWLRFARKTQKATFCSLAAGFEGCSSPSPLAISFDFNNRLLEVQSSLEGASVSLVSSTFLAFGVHWVLEKGLHCSLSFFSQLWLQQPLPTLFFFCRILFTVKWTGKETMEISPNIPHFILRCACTCLTTTTCKVFHGWVPKILMT